MDVGDPRTGVVTLAEDVCRRLLADHDGLVGRLAVVDPDGRPRIFPVNYLYLAGSVVLRTGPGTKLDAALGHSEVAFEIDGVDAATRTGWSVVVNGRLSPVHEIDALLLLRATGLEPFAGGDKRHWVSIDADHISGRCIPMPRPWHL